MNDFFSIHQQIFDYLDSLKPQGRKKGISASYLQALVGVIYLGQHVKDGEPISQSINSLGIALGFEQDGKIRMTMWQNLRKQLEEEGVISLKPDGKSTLVMLNRENETVKKIEEIFN